MDKEIAEKLNRTKNSIYAKRVKLNLWKKGEINYKTSARSS